MLDTETGAVKEGAMVWPSESQARKAVAGPLEVLLRMVMKLSMLPSC